MGYIRREKDSEVLRQHNEKMQSVPANSGEYNEKKMRRALVQRALEADTREYLEGKELVEALRDRALEAFFSR